jgi:3-hydroxyisobutyrate dehydrogenase
MGAAIVERLLSCGHEVHVWNRTAQKARALIALGARAAATPAALADASEAVLTILTDADAIRTVYLAAGGLLHGTASGKLFIEMSTVRARVQQEIASEVRARGAAFVECPVGGTVGPAREGKLMAFVGGEAADIERALPLLEQLCRRVEHVGEIGAGAAVKLAANLPMHVYWAALREAVTLCAPLQLSAERMIDMFADTSGAPASLRARAASVVAIVNGKESARVDFDIDSIRKDLALMVEEARAVGSALPVTERTLECFDAASRSGAGGKPGAALLTLQCTPSD